MVFPAICKSMASASWLNRQGVAGLVLGARCLRYTRDLNQGQDWFELAADSGNARIRRAGTRRDQDQEGRWQAGGSVWQAGQHQVKVAAKLLVAACFSTTSKST